MLAAVGRLDESILLIIQRDLGYSIAKGRKYLDIQKGTIDIHHVVD